MDDGYRLSDEIVDYYGKGRERDRLLNGKGRLEYLRTQELLGRYLPPPPASVLDIGGGAGVHALPLARLGYSVDFIDPVPLHVAQATEASKVQPDAPLAGARVGDARSLDASDDSVDAVLLLGPLYHLTSESDRLQALWEAHRVLRRGGILVASAISRFASMYDWLHMEYVEKEFEDIVERDLSEGLHENPDARPGWFTTAYFHRPEELRNEVSEASFTVKALVAVEGVASTLTNVDFWLDDRSRQNKLLSALRRVESEPSLLGSSSHLIAVGRK